MFDAETGLTRFGARDYDARVGRWVSKDPILLRAQQWNLFLYAQGDPVNRADPFGLADCPAISQKQLCKLVCEGIGSKITEDCQKAKGCAPGKPGEPPDDCNEDCALQGHQAAEACKEKGGCKDDYESSGGPQCSGGC